MNDQHRTPDRAQRINSITGCGIVVASISMLFWWGIHFRVFDSKIEWIKHPEQIGFMIWIVTGAFGAGFMVGGARAGGKTAISFALMLVGAALIGTLRTAFV